jgi:hypothetical protein
MAVIAAIFVTLASGPAVADDLIESWSVQGWDGGAYRNSDTGEVYCAMWDDYGSGTGIWLGWDVTGFYINLTDPGSLNLQTDTTFWTAFRIDTIYYADVEAYVMDPTTINIDFGQNRNAINAIKAGQKMFLDEWELWYTLIGTGAAVSSLETCYWNYN